MLSMASLVQFLSKVVLVDAKDVQVVLPAWSLFRCERQGRAIMANQASTYYLKLEMQPGKLVP